MKLHRNKTIKKAAQHTRRKRRTNTILKAQHYDARVLISKSLKYMTAQVIDPQGAVLASISDKNVDGATKTERAAAAWQALAQKIASLDVQKIVFDRNGYLYHGRVKAFADGLREGGVAI